MYIYLRARPGQERAPSAPEDEEGDAERGEEDVGQARVVLEAVVCVPVFVGGWGEGWVGILAGREGYSSGRRVFVYAHLMYACIYVHVHYVLLPVDVDGHEREAVAQGQLDEPLADAEHQPVGVLMG